MNCQSLQSCLWFMPDSKCHLWCYSQDPGHFGWAHWSNKRDKHRSEPPWKQRKYGHNSDFKHKKKGTSNKGTTLSKYIWTLKDPDDCNLNPCPNKIEWIIEWKILARAKGYNPITGVCRLCLKESYFLLFKVETASLNKRSEIFAPCPHRKFKFLANAKITWKFTFLYFLNYVP